MKHLASLLVRFLANILKLLSIRQCRTHPALPSTPPTHPFLSLLISHIWFDFKNCDDETCYMGTLIKDINTKLSNVFLLSKESWLSASLSLRSDLKSSECKNLLLYYGPFNFKGFLPEPFLQPFLLLSASLYLFNRKSITLDELRHAKKLELFAKDFEKCYGLVNMSFYVRKWVPLWITS